jgi:hypothetical protein
MSIYTTIRKSADWLSGAGVINEHLASELRAHEDALINLACALRMAQSITSRHGDAGMLLEREAADKLRAAADKLGIVL